MIAFAPLSLAENETKLIAFLSDNQEQLQQIPSEKSKSFSLGLYDDNCYIGGITATHWMNATHISLLAVNIDYQGKGYGTALLQKAESFANQAGADIITVNTQDYQAKSFYEQYGYQVFGYLNDTPFVGTTKYYLVKTL